MTGTVTIEMNNALLVKNNAVLEASSKTVAGSIAAKLGISA